VENFLLGARLMGFTEGWWEVTQGGQETDARCLYLARRAQDETLLSAITEGKRRAFYLCLLDVDMLLHLSSAGLYLLQV
jgi:hypothetical protein